MAKSVYIAEKPSVAREFAKALKITGKNRDGYIEDDKSIVTWCVGHLVTMSYPEAYDTNLKKWSIQTLPFLPKVWKYEVIDGVKKQFEIVKGILNREDVDTIYVCTDSGREGEYIYRLVAQMAGVHDKNEKRVWIDSQTEEEIIKGINTAKDISEYNNLSEAAYLRAKEDYLMGINFSRVLTLKYGNSVSSYLRTDRAVLSVGRVMTCVLGMIVRREREIRAFVETPFYRVNANIKCTEDFNFDSEWRVNEKSKYFQSPYLYKENGFKKRESAENLIGELDGKQAVVKSLERGTSRKKAPLLFNLAELQAECSKRYKISPDETLQVAQDLYEKKLTTYPRTDARVLSTAVAKEIGKNLNRLKTYEPTKTYTERILKEGTYRNIARTQYTDDSKITDHYAIIPTGQLTELGSLSDLQRRVYALVVRRFLSIFYPAAEYETIKLVVQVGAEQLFASAKVLKNPGFLEIMGRPGNDENKEEESAGLLKLAEQLKTGDPLNVDGYEIKEGKTAPPKRYTSGSMVLAMENAGQLIEEEELREQIKGSGIGTSATRAEIIRKLVRIGYLNLNKKTQVLSPEAIGERVFEVVSMTVPALLNPKMTASWEKGLDGITRGTVIMEDYRSKLEDFIRKETVSMIEHDLTGNLAARIHPLVGKGGRGLAAKKKIEAVCPVCGGEMETTPFGYGCSNYKKDGSGCKFSIGTIAGRDLTEEEVVELLTKGHTEVLSGFISKSRKRFSVALVLEKDEEGKASVNFDFSKNEPEILEGVKCPVCGSDMEITSFGYSCVKHRNDPESCYFSIGKIAGKSLGVDDLTDLLQKGETEVLKGFTAKNKKKFSAALCLKTGEDGRKTVEFDFSKNEAEILEDVVCPMCGGQIQKTSFGYGCMNYDQQNPQSCRFAIGTLAGRDLTESQVKSLLTDGRTETIRGFKSKTGKKFDACVALETDETGRKYLKFDFDHVEAKKIKDVSCPLCGGDIVQTPFGYGCANYKKDDPESCRLSIGKMGEKTLNEAQVKQLLTEGRTATIRGFKSKTGKKFDARIALNKDESGRVTGLKYDFSDVEAPKLKDVKCPVCGGDMVKTPFGYGCANYKKDDPESCRFSVGQIAGVKLKEAQVKELLTNGKTGVIEGFIAKTGMKFDAPLKLTKEGQITFDFPEKPKPVETTVKCPKCGELLKKSQWYYECDCGFKVGHTVAKVPLSEAIIKELLETGKTKEKVTGFNSKAGNVFDSLIIREESLSKNRRQRGSQKCRWLCRKMRLKNSSHSRQNRHRMVRMISMPLWRMRLQHFRNRKKQNGSLEVIF